MKIIFIISSTILFIADFAFAQDQNYGNNQTDQIIDDIRKYQLDYYNLIESDLFDYHYQH